VKAIQLYLTLLVLIAMSSCTTNLQDQHNPSDEEEVPATWEAKLLDTEVDNASLLNTWGMSLPVALTNQLEKVSTGNLQLYLSQLRLTQASLDFDITSDERLPDTRLTLTNGQSQTDVDNNSDWSNSLRIAVSASWELDLWGKLDDGIKQDGALFQAKGYEYQALKQSLQGQVINNWLTIVEQQHLLELNQKNLENQERRMKMSLSRLDYGLAGGVDIRNARTNLLRLQESRTQLQLRLNIALRQFNVLLGNYPNTEMNFNFELPELIPLFDVKTPKNILLNRPDIQQAEFELIAAGFAWQVAKKNQLPRLTFSFSIDHQPDDFKRLFDFSHWLSAVSASIVQPIFYRGVLKKQEQRAKLSQEIELTQYKTILLTAWQEVENAIENESQITKRLGYLQQALIEAKEAEYQVERLYIKGLANSFELLSIQRTRWAIESDLVSLTVNRLKNRVQLQLALGLPTPEKSQN
jgi:outer membrane protein TolC